MRTLPTGLLLSAALLTMVLPMATAETTPADAPVQFGMDAGSVAAQKAAGVAPDYGTFWIGPWTLSSGWGGPDAQLTNMKNAGVTPAIHFYYWGDDISPSCVENGCYSSLHSSQKDRAGWEKLGTQLTDHLNAKMGGAPVVIFLESEFNKGGIEKYEPFDGYMAAMADKIHAAYPNAIVVLGFGNWGSTSWGTFDRAAAASDMVGIQGMRGSTRQNVDGMYNLYEGLLAGVKSLETKFPGKPIMLTDIAVSSYPEPSYLGVQAGVLKEVLDNLDTLKAHGVEAMIYRSWRDSKMDPANYYGQAESHWGLAWQSNGTMKESGKAWVAAVKAERSGSSPAPVTSSPTSTTSTTSAAKVTPSGNEWWIQAGVSSTKAVTKVEAKVGSGSFVALNKESYGWAKSIHAVKGTPVEFRVTASDGQVATTAAQAWLVDMTPKTASYGTASSTTTTSAAPTTTTSPPTTTAAPTTTTPPTTTSTTTTTSSAATVKVTPSGNTWWVQAGASSTKAILKVEAKAGSGDYVALDHKSYGWAKSFHVAKGTMVQFRVTASDGTVATTAPQAWLVDMSAKTASFGTASSTTTTTVAKTTTTAATTTTTAATTSTTSSTTTAFRAYFSPQSVSDNTLVKVGVTANKPIAKVEAKVLIGTTSSPYVQLEQTSPGVYAKAMNVPDGAKVTIRATSTTGQTYSSIGYTWG